MPDTINEDTKFSLAISSWWHVVVIVAVILGCYFGLKADTDKAVAMSMATSEAQKEQAVQVNQMQMNIQSVADDVKWFRQTYERDMNHYIRDPRRQ